MIFLGQCRNIICTSWKYFYLSIHEESFLLSPLSYFEYVIHRFTNFSNDYISVCNQETFEWMFLFYKVNYFKFIVGHDSSGQFPRREQFQTVSRCLLAPSAGCTSCPFPYISWPWTASLSTATKLRQQTTKDDWKEGICMASNWSFLSTLPEKAKTFQ